MNINPVSFGKTVKVYAPYETVQQIVQAANNRPSMTPDNIKKAREIFNDTDRGHAVAFSFNKKSGENYIFSGNESKQFLKIFFKHDLLSKQIKRNNHENDSDLQKEEDIKYFKEVMNLINKTKEDYSIFYNADTGKIE